MQQSTECFQNPEAKSSYRVVRSLTHPMSAAALRLWQQRPADGIVIGRDVPSRAVARLLSGIVVYRPVNGGRDLLVHLAGDSIRLRFNADITGRLYSQMFTPAEFPIRFHTIMEALEYDEPRMASVSHSNGTLEILRLELLILPAWSPDRSERWPLVFCFYV